jgi:hypothetical protein
MHFIDKDIAECHEEKIIQYINSVEIDDIKIKIKTREYQTGKF